MSLYAELRWAEQDLAAAVAKDERLAEAARIASAERRALEDEVAAMRAAVRAEALSDTEND